MDMHTPLSGLVLHPAYHLTTISPLPIKRFFICRFRDLDLLSLTHHLGCPSRTNLSMPLQVPCLVNLSWHSAHTCLAAKICKPFRHPLAFVANAQLPPCHKACHPTLCLGTMHLRCRTKPFWHTFASWNLCEWISVWPTSCFRQKTRLGPMTTTHFSIF